MSAVGERTQRRLHKHHDDDPDLYGFDFWCVAHGDRKGCHDPMGDSGCSYECNDCPVACPFCPDWEAARDGY